MRGRVSSRYPRCQFTEQGDPLPHLAEVLGALTTSSGWVRLSVLLSPVDPVHDRTVLDVLRAGPSREELRETLLRIRGWGD